MLSKLLAPTMAQQVVNLLPRTSGYTPHLSSHSFSVLFKSPHLYPTTMSSFLTASKHYKFSLYSFILFDYLISFEFIARSFFFPTITPFYRCLHLFLSLSLSLVVAEVVDLVTVEEEVGLVEDLVTVVAGEEASPVLPQPKKNLGISWKCFGHYIHIQHYSTFDFVSV